MDIHEEELTKTDPRTWKRYTAEILGRPHERLNIISEADAIAMGYLGVRREQVAEPDLTALVREAIAEFRRDVKQQTKAADWAFKWVGRFIEAVEK